CVNCGQCRVYCPTAAISIKSNRDDAWEAIDNTQNYVVAQVAPSVRVAVGQAFGLPEGEDVMGKVVAAMHQLGFAEVYDTNFSADLTIMEESAEFLERVKNGGKLPLLTSCCPAWVKFVGDQFPDFTENVSTCRSPQGMMSAVVKEYFRDPANNNGKKVIMVSVMPCTAKKMEAKRPNSYTKGEKDTDIVLTTTELIDMIRTSGIDFKNIAPEAADVPFGFGSGGGVIFGVTGGVTEAVIRRLATDQNKSTMESIANCGVRQSNPSDFIREFVVPYNGLEVKICVASGLANARKVMEQVRNGEKEYHLIEIMACRRGCVMGGGQPKSETLNINEVRTKGIYSTDLNNYAIKKCDFNPTIQSFYAGFLKGKEHELLHNHEFCAK
ncbi:iron hydrogenase small subunit, partial [bacterium]|nr:iron hydrogenase small subunit [bacterium]